MESRRRSSRQRPSVGNVIYANFGTKKRVTTAAETKVVDVGPQVSPAAARVLEAVRLATDAGRLGRGHKYAETGHVLNVSCRVGAVHGQVAGSQNEPFVASLLLPPRDEAQLADVTRLLSANPNGMTRARRGQLDDAVLDLLLWEDPSEARYSCDCPDPSRVCKHVVAMTDRLAVKIDADPEVVFSLRGLSLTYLEGSIVRQVEASLKEPGGGQLADFWDGGQLPDCPTPTVHPTLGASDMDLLHKAMRAVSFTSIDELRAVSDIEEIFDYLTDDDD